MNYLATGLFCISVLSLGSTPIVVALENPTGKFESESEGKDFDVTNMSAVYQGRSYANYPNYGEHGSVFGNNNVDKFFILGNIKNIGNTTYGNVSIIANLYNNESGLVDLIEGTPIHDIGRPNSSSPYKIYVELHNASDFDHYLIQVIGKK